jgi:Raf kinase inhibitor-like YbhB/YbcL family protein
MPTLLDRLVPATRRLATDYVEVHGRLHALPLVCALLTGCNAQNWSPDMKVTSTAFADGKSIPARFTCEGADVSPELSWRGVPEEAESLALIVEDPDAPDPKAPKTIWTHWVLYDLPTSTIGLAEGVDTLPEGTREGKNDWKQTGYRGPCPPIGRHRYFFKLFALDTRLGDLEEPTRSQLLQAMTDHVLATGTLVGTYQKTK